MRKRAKFSDYASIIGLIILAAMLIFYFMGCKRSEEAIQADRQGEAAYAVDKIVYVEDNRTGLCFAMLADRLGTKWGYAALTNVPCETVKDFFYRGEGYLGDGR